jgi:mono/diheme cytochrome c family protein
MKSSKIFQIAIILAVVACSPKSGNTENAGTTEEKSLITYVDLTDPLDESLIQQGTTIFKSKCAKCHTLDTVRFTAPEFAGVTNRRSPEWIMNMVLNVDEMLKQDPVAADLLRRHKKVMPDPELSVDQTRAVLEFLRNNDLEQIGEKDKAANL